MIVRAISDTFRDFPREALPRGTFPESQTLITKGKDYVVHAIAVFEGNVCFQIVDDADVPFFTWASLFTVVDRSIPIDWECNLFAEKEPRLVIGPSFISSSLQAYSRMANLADRDQLDKFWRRVRELG